LRYISLPPRGIGERTQLQARRCRFGRRAIDIQGPGRAVAFNKTIGVGLHWLGLLDELALVADLHRTFGCGTGVEAQSYLLAHQGGIDLIEHPIEADGAILLHLALGLEQE
jgi:hypothetical protein